MKKEEFPTFLNEQPTIIFGRTGRELLIMAIGGCIAWLLWVQLAPLQHTLGGLILSIVLVSIPALLSVVVALISIGGRTMEEWAFILTFYALMPKLFLYMPLEEQEAYSNKPSQTKQKQIHSSPQPLLLPTGRDNRDDIDDDEES